MTDSERRAAFDAAIARTRSPSAALRAIFEAGFSAGRLSACDGNPVEAIRRAVAQRWGITVAALVGNSRRRTESWARGEFAWLLRNVMRLSMQDIAQHCHYSDHTCVLHMLKVTERRISEKPGLRDELLALSPVVAVPVFAVDERSAA